MSVKDTTGETTQTPSAEQGSSVPTNTKPSHILLPRKVVYFQGALLGIVATTFFIFGMMVGSLTGGPSTAKIQSCRVTGFVTFQKNGSSVPDSGSVVLLLPIDSANIQRQSPEQLRPNNFKPLNNPAIEMVHQAGGVVVRADESGKFDVYVDSPRSFDLLVISRNQKGKRVLTKSEMAGIGKFFLPVETLLGDNQFVWKRVATTGKQTDLGQVDFREK